MKQLLAVVDRSPLGPAPWMKKAADGAGFAFVDDEALSRQMAQDPGFQEAVMSPEVKNFQNPHQAPQLAPYYRQALSALTAGKPKVLVYGWGWLVFAEKVDGCLLDFSGYGPEHGKAKTFVREQAKKSGLSGDRLLELSPAAPDADKETRARELLVRLAR